MSDNDEKLGEFLSKLQDHALCKAELYDGMELRGRKHELGQTSVDEALRFAIEELGEVAAAISRNRILLAQAECLDLAHCAFLIWMELQ